MVQIDWSSNHVAGVKKKFQRHLLSPPAEGTELLQSSRCQTSTPTSMTPLTHVRSPDVDYLLLPVRRGIDQDIQETRLLPVTQAELQRAAQLLRRPHQKTSASKRCHDLVVAGLRQEGHRWRSEKHTTNKQKKIGWLVFVM